MHIRDAADSEDGPINLTSMMDMVFNLLIFFLVATTIVEEERDLTVKLPETVRADAVDTLPKQLVINIQEDGSLVVAGDAYDPAGLSAMLAKAAQENPAPNVLIRSDERTPFRHFADVVDRCREAGISEAKIGYVKQGG
jgi:biopolymer transport protein ExbD